MAENQSNGAVLTDPEKTVVAGHTTQGSGINARLLRVTRQTAALEFENPATLPRVSEVLQDFRIVVSDRTVYSGRAVVRNIVNTGVTAVSEVALDEKGWVDVTFSPSMLQTGELKAKFQQFVMEWQNTFRVAPEFKVMVADAESYLSELRLWLEQVELEIRSSPSADRTLLERQVVDEIAPAVIKSIDVFVDRFESLVTEMKPEDHPVHREYLRRQLHSLLLSSPFAYRAYHKPLGYAGDYEMVSMMLREPYEGSTLFAKTLNVWLLGQSPALAHRNRVVYLHRKLIEEKLRLERSGRPARVFNLGCGPAEEVQQILRNDRMNTGWQFNLLDFNEETLQSFSQALAALKGKYPNGFPVHLVKKSVQQLLKESVKAVTRRPEDRYDVVYCAGLFDYLPDPTCKRLMNIMYDMLAPGGLLMATNVTDVMNSTRPFRYSMEYMLDWYLIYRDRDAFARVAPDEAPADSVSIIAESTGVNVFMEVRKPENV
ncbi:MAG TPA: class I SAM-dependent methyltransferase [Verrucomicrobiae bacterium]|nr:class I SAM-dependent methyltransferase [Verrucomicrobiae bacterium]